MEEKEGVNSFGVTVKGDEASESYRVAPRIESNNNEFISVAATPVSVTEETKKRRGRPRKYGPDGKVAAVALSPMPISASIPLTADFSPWKNSTSRPVDSIKKKNKFEVETPGERMAYPVGANFTPHVITVNAGEGRFEILSLTGSFMPSDNGVTKSRSGGMSVCLSGPDGRVMGGGLAGMLLAAGPVQVVVGSFIPGHQLEQKPKKQRVEHAAFAAIPAPPISEVRTGGAYSGPSPNIAASISFPGDNANSIYSSRISTSQSNISLPGEESKEQNPSS
ncbi:AT-hook motif nuclear-localized protein 6 isoform X2 [Lycium ferocissimum]|uniref:AT-hook motif nuclear-localized protein 6 isoform X2 n=1 Tax=Lycium ferocissimum TaxID=112874 RepID=UPI00281619CA|nr:AT-hook motif nuclear-localized protein 6 isoform X2 [Lycium ferocissimum]